MQFLPCERKETTETGMFTVMEVPLKILPVMKLLLGRAPFFSLHIKKKCGHKKANWT